MAGHYVDLPLPDGRRVPAGESLRELVVLRPAGDALPFQALVLEEGSKAEICIVVMPGVSGDLSLSADFVGKGAELKLSGIYLCGGSEKLEIHTEVRHRVPECLSNQSFNGIVGGRAHAGFYGRIVVAPDAQKTEAYQSNRNILLSEAAKTDTRPQLEIYADDVKCSHGATVGSLNEEEQFYMRSRGVPEAEAKVLQMISFVAPVLDQADEALVQEIESAIRDLAL